MKPRNRKLKIMVASAVAAATWLAPLSAEVTQATTLKAVGNVNLRAKGLVSAKKVGSVHKGDIAEYLGTVNDWYKISIGGIVGYSHKAYWKGHTVTASKNVSVRASSSIEADKVGYARAGSEATVLGRNGGWINLELDGVKGFSHKSYWDLSDTLFYSLPYISAEIPKKPAQEEKAPKETPKPIVDVPDVIRATKEVKIKSPQPGDFITSDYILRYSVNNTMRPVSILIKYRNGNGAQVKVPVTPLVSSSAESSYETKLVGLGGGQNQILVQVKTKSGVTFFTERDVTVQTKLTNIMTRKLNVAPYTADRNKYKNLLMSINGARAVENGLVAKDAAYIHRFVETLFEEAALEGIRPDIVFTQMMLETGWLTFSGTVRENQNNFGGIGATGGGVRGNPFMGMREGIRANVQHLKAYASSEPLRGVQMDPRFGYVARGSASWVEQLGYQENPNGFGWAMSSQYGFLILNSMERLDKASAEPFKAAPGTLKITELEACSIARNPKNPLDVTFIAGFQPGQELRIGLSTNSDTEHRTIITNQTTGKRHTTSWSENRAVYYLPDIGHYQFRAQIRAKGAANIAAVKTLKVQIGKPPALP